MRRLVGLLCLGLLASGPQADARPKKPRPAPVRGGRDAGDPCETDNLCKAGLVCLEAKCRTIEWAGGAIILLDIARQVGGGRGDAIQRQILMQAAGFKGSPAEAPARSYFEAREALQNGAVPVEAILSTIRGYRGFARGDTQSARESAAMIMADHFPPMRLGQAYEMLFGHGTGTPPPVPEPPPMPPMRVSLAGKQRPQPPKTPPEPAPAAPSWASEAPSTPVAGKAAAGPLDDVDRLADLAELVPERPGPQTPAPRAYHGIGEYVGAVGPDGLPEGEGRMVYLGGGSYAGSWRAGQWHGAGTMVRPDGQIVRGTFERGRLVKGETFNRRREN